MNIIRILKTIAGRKSIIIAFAIILLYTIICGAFSPALFSLGVILTVVYTVIVIITLGKDYKTRGLTSENGIISNITLDFVMSFNSPIVIINETGIINWYNKEFIAISETGASMYGKNISDTISDAFTSQRIEQLLSGVTVDINFNGTDYEVTGYKLNSAGKQYCLTVWEDKTELNMTKRMLLDGNVLVAYCMVDFVSEMEYMQDKYRNLSVQVATALENWAQSLGGIVKEFEKDKYVIFFEEKNYKSLIDSKFDILDTIRELSVNDSNINLTVSIGLAKLGGTLSEKDAAARRALDLALQRGGDQAVVRTENSTEYYGGKTKTVQKRTKIRSRVFAKDLVNLIKNSGNVVIMGHKYIDHDAVASAVAVARIAKLCETDAKIVVNIHDANLKPIFTKMRGFTSYTEMFTDAISAQNLLRSDTLLVVCDVNNPSHFESPEIFYNCAKVVIIDHHRKTGEYLQPPTLAYIEPAASSTSELMCELLEQILEPGSLTKTEAELLFAGITLDTHQFTKNTGVRTFSAAQYLRDEGADPQEAKKLFRTSIDEFLSEIKFESNIIVYKDSIAIAAQKGEYDSIDKIAAAKAADKLLSIEGVDASFVVFSINDQVHISARSNGTINVQLLLEKLGGGGHFDAAGVILNNIDVTDALNLLKAEIDKYLEDKQ